MVMSDKIKIRLSSKAKARDKGAEYFILEDHQYYIFYDAKGKELWREKELQKESHRFESKEL